MGQVGRSWPVWMSDRWFPSRVYLLWPPERGPGQRDTVTHPLPPGRPSWCLGWRVAQRPAPDRGTSTGPRRRSVGADMPLRPRWTPNPASLLPSPPDNFPAPPLPPQSPQGSNLASRSEGCSPGRRPPPAWRSVDTRLIWYWSDPGSSLAGVLSPSDSPGCARSAQRCHPLQVYCECKTVYMWYW